MMTLKNRSMILYFVYYLAYSSLYIARMNFSVASAFFEEMMILDKAQIGIIGSVFSFSYAFMKIPGGYIGDRRPAQKVIVVGLIIVAVSNLAIGFLPHFYTILLLWGMNGIGQSLLWGPTLRLVNAEFEGKRAKLLCQWLSSSVAVGSILGLFLAGICSNTFGASVCFMIPGIICLLMAGCIRFMIPGWKKEQTKKQLESKNDSKKETSVKDFLCDKRLYKMFIPAISHGMIKDNLNVWLAIYFADVFGIDLKALVYYVFLIPVFGLIGRMGYPLLYRIFKNDERISKIAFGGCVMMTALLCWNRMTPIWAMLCIGTISTLVSVINVHMLSMFPSHFASTGNVAFAASCMDVLTYGGAGIGSLIFGKMIAGYGFQSMFVIWGILSLISIACLAFKQTDH